MKVNFIARTIEMSAKEMRRASLPHSREYTELLRVLRDLPDFTIEIHRSKHPTNKDIFTVVKSSAIFEAEDTDEDEYDLASGQ